MKKIRTLKEKILLRISLKRDKVFTRDDFNNLGGYDQVGRALKQLVESKNIIKIGYGLYVKTKVSSITGVITLKEPLAELAREALTKLGIQCYIPKSTTLYNEGKSTQVPTGRTIAVTTRVSRKISYNGAYINYKRSA